MRRTSVARSISVNLAAGALLAMGAVTAAEAQSTAGVGADATPVPVHGTRINIGGLWTNYDSRFAPDANGDIKKSGLFSGFSRDNLGANELTALTNPQSYIRNLSGLGDAFALSLGQLEAKGEVNKSVVPLQIDFGVTNRLSLSLMVPYVETRNANSFVLNRGGLGANVGQNPSRANSVALATNTAVTTQIESSRTLLTQEIARCADVEETGGGCAAIRANPAAAQALLTQAAAFKAQIGLLYGTTSQTGAVVVPVAKSAAQLAIEQKLAALRTSFVGYSANGLDTTSRPVAATVVYATGALQGIAKDTAFALDYDTLAIGGRAGIGDVELSATYLVLNTMGNSQYDRLTLSRKGVRTAVSGGWRFGTATGGRSGSPFDLPTGDGANALLLRSTTDLVWSRRFWVSGTLRYAKPLADNVVTRFAPISDSTLFRPSITLPAERKLGAHTEIEIAPRFGIGRSFGISAAYLLARQDASTLNAQFPDVDVVNAFAVPDYGSPFVSTTATTTQSLYFGASYSTLNAFVRGKSRWPLEIVYSHGMVLGASGGIAPATVSDRIELRIYTRFPRR